MTLGQLEMMTVQQLVFGKLKVGKPASKLLSDVTSDVTSSSFLEVLFDLFFLPFVSLLRHEGEKGEERDDAPTLTPANRSNLPG